MRNLMVVLGSLILAAPAVGQSAQPRFQIGVGLGVADVIKAEGGGSNVSPTVSAELGFGLGHRGMAVVLEGARFGTLDDDPETTDITPAGAVVRTPDVFETTTVMLSLRVPVSDGLYVRPGAGAGQNAFASYLVGASTVETAEVSHEWGPAAGIAVGHDIAPAGLSLAVEGALVWTGGEDSSPDRTILVLRIVPRFRL